MNHRLPGESRFLGWLFIFPGLSIYLIFVLIPMVETFRLSFFEWNGFSLNQTFVAFQNYARLFQDSQFFKSILHNSVFLIFYSLLPILLGLFLANILGRKITNGLTGFRVILFLPQVLSMVVVGITWRWIFNPAFGPLNVILKSIGLDSLAGQWLGDFNLALPSVGIIGTWVMYGFSMVLFLAGMQRIPLEYFEAAQLDGAGEFQQFIFITLPSLIPEIGVALITTIIAALRVFDLVYVTTRGSPGDQTLVTSFLIYRAAFLQNQVGYAAAVASIMTMLILIITFFITRIQRSAQEVD